MHTNATQIQITQEWEVLPNREGKRNGSCFLLYPSQSERLLFMGDRNKGDEQTVIKNVPTAQGKKSIQTLHKKITDILSSKSKALTMKIQKYSDLLTG